jgi:hypothetical protein
MDRKDWELIVIDDMSEDDVGTCLSEHGRGLRTTHHRLEHDMGMRGNTHSINYGVDVAQGNIVMWSTPEVMLPPMALQAAYETHAARPNERLWVTVPSHGLTAELQLKIDSVRWDDLHNLKKLVEPYPPEHWNSIWFYFNFFADGNPRKRHKANYGNNQTVAVRKSVWQETIGSFPLFCDYGSDDPWVATERRKHGFNDITLWEHEAYHQWHATAQYWMAQGKAPNWNWLGHTTSNVANDPRVPDRGTCFIWDHGKTDPMTEEQRADALKQHDLVVATGFRRKDDTASN